MRVNYILLIVIIFFFEGCASLKKELFQSGSQNEVIKNAILDFSKTTKLYKENTAFSVKMVSIQEDFLAVRIGRSNMKMSLTDEIKVGSINKFPSRFIERDEKLFYWWDENYPLSQKALDLYKKYDLIHYDPDKFPDFIINDAQKAAHYYFCKNDFSKYRKVVTNIGMGYYDPPKLNCKPK